MKEENGTNSTDDQKAPPANLSVDDQNATTVSLPDKLTKNKSKQKKKASKASVVASDPDECRSDSSNTVNGS